MLLSYSTGLILGLSLILAIGSQNAFVLRQGILRQHVGPIVFFCIFADAFLIIFGVAGASYLISDFVDNFKRWLFGSAAIWLFGYGLLRFRDVIGNNSLEAYDVSSGSLGASLITAAFLTFGNPHVYLDTIVLIGAISLKYSGIEKVAFAAGTISASFIFFASLGYGGYLISSLMRRPKVWRVLNAIIALMMFSIAATMLRAGSWY